MTTTTPTLLKKLLLITGGALALLCATNTPAQTAAALRPGDTFELHLGGMPEEFSRDFLGQYTLGDDGNVTLPLIGPLHAAGSTPSQLQSATLQRALR